ncbi:hypothetical protein [Pseudodesulfovibrio indicus]|uniref:DUF945 domain-containing protein n=1 Tax=Pseudodesulfovibrio indicus TaxID=1716143 RepID=A0A140D908_9BACT|nr:hypothetical protein [Pseudodesulfovibrio indicus]AMK09675.1 hypothetical protein AWY79_00415 [Pseudodesulfovibrio indicus]TDT86371.1 hypothetical protein EDC59_11345 [Pseudodesulfovibrio indicus]
MSGLKKFLLSFVIFVTLCFFGLKWFVNSEVDKELSRAVAETPGLAFSYADLSVDIMDHAVTLEGVDALFPSGQHVQADEVSITAFDQKNAVPRFATLTARGLTIPVTPQNFGDWAPYLRGMGIETLSGNGALDYAYDPEGRILTVRTLSLDDPKLGSLRFSGQVGNLDLGGFRTEQGFSLDIREAALTFENRELMDLILADWAARMNVSRATTLNSISAELDGLANYADSQQNEPAKRTMLGLKRFLNEPGTLTLSASPAAPVPVLYFFMGRDLFENLSLLNTDARLEPAPDF